MEAKIGNYKIIFTQMFIVEDEEPVTLSEYIEGDLFLIRIYFYPDDKRKNFIEWKSEGEYLDIKFRGWKNKIGTAVFKPTIIGTTSNNNKVAFLAAYSRIGNVNKLDFQLLLGRGQR